MSKLLEDYGFEKTSNITEGDEETLIVHTFTRTLENIEIIKISAKGEVTAVVYVDFDGQTRIAPMTLCKDIAQAIINEIEAL